MKYLLLCCCFVMGCSSKKGTTLFSRVYSDVSGIDFENTITENNQFNLLTNEYTYMGGGVGVGDFNNDGWVDLFFTANQSSCRLYKNDGSFKFKDITKEAGLITDKWCTGVSVIDINSDGWLDIYICISGSLISEKRKNLLYINNHDLTFTEMAAQYGLDDDHFSTQACFFDYDKDGLLDMYLLNHQMYGESINRVKPKDLSGNSPRNDQLYHNEGIDVNTNRPHFKNVTLQSGIREDGYGLGIVVSDLNNDNWPDIYVSNDYIGNDCLWLNQKDGTFKNCIATSLNHQSYSSMGTDAADINNDGLPDIATVDMMPEDNERKKMMYSILTNERHEMEKYFGYEPSYMRNTLQLNRGNFNVHDTMVPVFSDIANYAGIAETDWSWSILAADFNYDGYKDIHITNGLGRDLLNNDFAVFSASRAAGGPNKTLLDELQKYGTVPLSNYFFVNKNGYSFTNNSTAAGIDEKAISNGCAYADLDNDGDLDLVVNNINEKAFIFSNNTINSGTYTANYLGFKLKGPKNNIQGIGARVKIFNNDSIRLLEEAPVRGYLSSVDERLFIGLGNANNADSVQVTWPDNKVQVIKNVKANQLIEIDYKDAVTENTYEEKGMVLFTQYNQQANIHFTHSDSFFFDYSFQRLLPQKYSSLGPGIAVGDINKDGLQDFYIGNGFRKPGMIFIQQTNGQFKVSSLEGNEKIEEDAGCLFFDADKDGDDDLLVTSGTNEFPGNSPYNQPRLYINNKGKFTRSNNAIPLLRSGATTVVKACDFDKDGDIDLFLGGRIANGNYPTPPSSFLLQNNNGVFSDVTLTYCPLLASAGMITDAAWMDFDADGMEDLILTGEWMPIRVFVNQKDSFIEVTEQSGLSNYSGLWRSISCADLDGDGDMDFVAGNLGMNNKFHFDKTYPLQTWYADVDGNGSIDPFLGYYMLSSKRTKELYTASGLAEIASQVPSIKKKYLLHKDFSTVTMPDLFNKLSADPKKLIANEAASCWFENLGNGFFVKHVLPSEAQFAPINCILVKDFNKDGKMDMIVAGNEYETEINTGRYDASYGLLLIGAGNKEFKVVPMSESGLYLRGDTRCMQFITVNKKEMLLAGINNSELQLYNLEK